ncbi:transcriptional regulator [Streptomyces rubiginosohelvolus]
MYDVGTRERTLALVAQGRSLNSVSKQTGISRAAIRSWQTRLEPLDRGVPCPRCSEAPTAIEAPSSYAYLLGLYLGDGCISAGKRGVHSLRIACVEAVQIARPDNKVSRVASAGCQYVTSFSKHWPCLFPQHGPGKKHDRRIALEPWQQQIVDSYPWEFIRGLFHSDGCRITNWATRMVRGERKRYEYPRYFFTNKSDDIRKLYGDTLTAVGVEWTSLARGSKPFNISVARRASVTLMDAHVGPKY